MCVTIDQDWAREEVINQEMVWNKMKWTATAAAAAAATSMILWRRKLATAYEIIINALRPLPTLQALRYFATPSKPICIQKQFKRRTSMFTWKEKKKAKRMKNIDTGETKKKTPHPEPMIHRHERKLISMQ